MDDFHIKNVLMLQTRSFYFFVYISNHLFSFFLQKTILIIFYIYLKRFAKIKIKSFRSTPFWETPTSTYIYIYFFNLIVTNVDELLSLTRNAVLAGKLLFFFSIQYYSEGL